MDKSKNYKVGVKMKKKTKWKQRVYRVVIVTIVVVMMVLSVLQF